MGEPDIFDEIADEIDIFDSVEEEDSSIETIKAELSTMLERFNESRRKADGVRFTQEMKDLIKKEIAKIKPIQNVIERTLEKQVLKNIHVPIQLPPPPKEKPQIIREVRVEVLKDSDKYAEKEYFEKLKSDFDELKKDREELKKAREQIEELKDIVAQMRETVPLMGVHGGPGVIGIPAPEPNPDGYILSISDGKAKWVVNSASSSGGAGSDPFYIGDPDTDGSWRFISDGDNLSVQKRESGTWNEKSAFLPS